MLETKITLKELHTRSVHLGKRIESYCAMCNQSVKEDRLKAIVTQLENSEHWENFQLLKALNQEKVSIELALTVMNSLRVNHQYLLDFISLSLQENDESSIETLREDYQKLITHLEKEELHLLFSLPHDSHNAFLIIKPGAGGTEAQDWAEMLLRMYLRWSESHNFTTTCTDMQMAEEAGIKHATVLIEGFNAYGWLRTEHGIHRLVRRSPFDSNNKRHTSFASVSVLPELDDSVEVTISPADLRIDVYRASGAGGQHVNRTESAVRVTHLPTGLVTQCQSDRSQHKNKSTALKQLRTLLYNRALKEKQNEVDSMKEEQHDIEWGYQIRSYVLDQSRIKDLRTGLEIGNTKAVLDGDLDAFIIASLKMNVSKLHETIDE
ncbi:MAG: peptide chain release factor 2 [Methylacidiphilales bacterium]|nr:peptide chain release factor 2 [Candidatus Methylacidiphilales bacterium]